MIPLLRNRFNKEFTKEKYQAFLKELNGLHPGSIEFRIAETPIFVPAHIKNDMLDTCEHIVDLILDKNFLNLTARSIPPSEKVPGDEKYPQMLAFDFGICVNDDGGLEPQLIEMQGFPSLYGLQVFYGDIERKHFTVPDNFTHYLGKHDDASFRNLLTGILLDGTAPENVILLEIKPHQQKTRVDFYCTEDITGIRPVCLTDLILEGKRLFYLRDGVKTQVKRIYNRIIFDELNTRTDLGDHVDITGDLDVEWVPHPNWFYRVSKFTLPFIRHQFVPETFFLNEVKQLPGDLENYVVKPLFSFAGQGVIIEVKPEDIAAITDPENWIIQKKVKYADAIITPDDPAKAEIRVMYLWTPGAPRPEPAINLARLSKGKMIGVRYNKDKEWVGGSVAYFES
jgi:hypothetical protein